MNAFYIHNQRQSISSQAASIKDFCRYMLTFCLALYLACGWVPQISAAEQDQAEDYYEYGKKLYKKGRLDEALKAFLIASEMAPDFSEAFREAAKCKLRLNLPEEAILLFDRAINADPSNAKAFLGRGVARGQLGDPEGAAAEYTEAIRIDPGYANAFYNRGLIKTQQKQYTAAEADFRKALELNPDHYLALNSLGVVLEVAQKDHQAAIDCYSRSIRLQADYADAWHNRALARFRSGDQANALADANRAVSLSPQNEKYLKTRQMIKGDQKPSQTIAAQEPVGNPKRSSSGSAISGVTVHAGDGACLTSADGTGAIRSVMAGGEAAYAVRCPDMSESGCLVSLPMPKPQNRQKSDAPVEVATYDQTSHSWKPLKTMIVRDDPNNMIHFSVDPASEEEAWMNFRAQQRYGGGMECIYKTDRFVIQYPCADIIDNAKWATLVGSPTGHAKNTSAPDFIADMGAALEKALTGLLAINGAGGKVFNSPSLPLKVFVKDLGPDPGGSPIGGPMELSNKRFENRAGISAWQDLYHVAAHELVHVLQNRYYTGGKFGNLWNKLSPGNRWFIEASANYFAARACNAPSPVKREFYIKDGRDDYLSTSLTTNSDQNYYMVGAFLEWLSDTYSSTIIHQSWKKGGTNDLSNLDAVLKENSEPNGISGAFEKYCKWLISHPDAVAGMNDLVKDKLSNQSNATFMKLNRYDNFVKEQTYMRYTATIAPLSAHYFAKQPRTRDASLLVLDVFNDPNGVQSVTYDMVGATNSDYANKSSLEKTISGSKPRVIANMGRGQSKTGFEQMLINPSKSKSARVDSAYYLLHPPTGIQTQKGGVSWSTADVGNIPLEYIKGYHAYLDGRKLTTKGAVPYAPNRQSVFHSDIQAGSQVVVTILDKYGNEWPKVIPPKQGSKSPVGYHFVAGISVDQIPVPQDEFVRSTTAFRGDLYPIKNIVQWSGNDFTHEYTSKEGSLIEKFKTHGRIAPDGSKIERIYFRYERKEPEQNLFYYDQVYEIELINIPFAKYSTSPEEENIRYMISGPQTELKKYVKHWNRQLKGKNMEGFGTGGYKTIDIDPKDGLHKASKDKKGTISVTFRKYRIEFKR